MFPRTLLIALTLVVTTLGQNVGTLQAENHPPLPFQNCTKSGGCTTVSAGQIVLDANWRWTHINNGSTNCYTGNTWNTAICPDGATCAANCAVDGADYAGTYGISTSGNALTLNFVTNSNSKNVGSRVYLMSTDTLYATFNLINREFTFDVDVSNLPCGLNGAVYFTEMDADGGMAEYPSNKAGAKYGTGYCDSQCPKDIKFINGEANVEGWTPSTNDPNSGTGSYGTCCTEMDIWEANKISAAFTSHPCALTGPTRCSGDQCNTPTNRYSGVCDPDGCDFNSYRTGNTSFYGPDMVVDTSRPFTLVTQFLTSDGTDSGDLTEIRRIYVQDGKVIQNSQTNIPGLATYDSITDKFCTEQKSVFGDTNSYQTQGAMAQMEKAFRRGMVLSLSLWDDYYADMLWLDSTYPANAPSGKLGATRGTCATTSGSPQDIEANNAGAAVTFSNIKFGEIGSTFSASGSSSGSSSSSSTIITSTTRAGTPSTPDSATVATQTQWGQCAGQGYTGPTKCASSSSCVFLNTWYSQCQ